MPCGLTAALKFRLLEGRRAKDTHTTCADVRRVREDCQHIICGHRWLPLCVPLNWRPRRAALGRGEKAQMEKETDVVPGTVALASAKSFNIPQKIHFTKVFEEFYVSQIGLQTLQE